MVGSYSDVHCERTRRSVMLDFPAPPSPQMVMEMGVGGCDVAAVVGMMLCEGACLRDRDRPEC